MTNKTPMPHTTANKKILAYPPVRPYGSRNKIIKILFSALMLFTGICILIAGTTVRMLRDDLIRNSALNKGQRTEALIINRWIEDLPDKSYFYLRYQFEVDEQSFENDAEVDKLLYDVYKEGMKLAVVYLPEAPANSLPETSLQRELQIAWLMTVIIPGLFLGLPAVLLLLWWWCFRRLPDRLRKHGLATRGTIIECWDEGQGKQRMIAYDFQVRHPNGDSESMRGKEQLPDSAPIVALGETSTIRNLAEKPKIFMLEFE